MPLGRHCGTVWCRCGVGWRGVKVEGYGAGVGGSETRGEGRVQWHPFGHGVHRVLERRRGLWYGASVGAEGGMVREREVGFEIKEEKKHAHK